MMKKTFAYLLLLPLACAGFVACEKDEHTLTGENGRLGCVTYLDTHIEYSYANQRMTQIWEKGQSLQWFTYKGDELENVSAKPDNPDIADGGAWTNIKREGSKIILQSSGEPSFEIYEKVIELDENEMPVKISEEGIFEYGTNGLEQIGEGRQYALFTFDPSTRNLLKQEVFNKETNERIALYEYEYENSPGVMSKSGLPLWYHIWRIYSSPYGSGDHRDLFLNYANNISLKKVDDSRYEQSQKTVRYDYTYNKAGFPIALTRDANEEGRLSIRY